MDLYVEILAKYLSSEKAHIIFPDLQLNAKEIVELQCMRTLKKIRELVLDDTLDDAECFERIEQIICSLEEIGIDAGSRHDFG